MGKTDFVYKICAVWLLAAAVCFFSCKQAAGGGKKDEPVIPRVTAETVAITVKGGAGVKVNGEKIITAEKGSSWATVKKIAERSISFEDGVEGCGWKLHSLGGGYLENTYIFNEDKTIFAISKPKGSPDPEKIKISVEGDKGIYIFNLTPVTADKGSLWKDVKFSVQDKTASKTGFDISCWKLENENGGVLQDGYSFNQDIYVFAVTELKKYKVTFKQPENGTLTAKLENADFVSGSEVKHGQIITFTAKPDFNYKVKKWTGIDNNTKAGNTVKLCITAVADIAVEMEKNTGKPEITCLNLPGTGTFGTDFNYKHGDTVNIKIKGNAFNTSAFDMNALKIKVADTKNKEFGSIVNKTLEDCETLNISYRFPSFAEVPNLENLKVIAELNGKKMEEQFLPACIENSVLKKWNADSSLEEAKLPEYILEIADAAFKQCGNLRNIDLGNSLETIGIAAFEECRSLISVTIPESVTEIKVNDDGWNMAFLNCSGIKNIEIKNKIIGAGMFLGCTGLQDLIIPPNVLEIGKCAFLGCTGLKEITIPETLKEIDEKVFSKCYGLTKIDIQSSVIGASMFEECSALESITIPVHVTRLKTDRVGRSAAFKGCNSLKTVKLENGILGAAMFQECVGLEKVTIPANITEFQLNDTKWNSAFIGCTGLKDIKIETNIIPAGIFASCYGLEKLYIPENIKEIHRAAFGDCENLMFITVDEKNPVFCCEENIVYTKDKTELVFAPASKTVINIPGTVTKINDGAFFGCMDLRKINIGDNVKYIGEGAFLNCERLESVTIGRGCTEIGEIAFRNCFRIEEMIIKSEVLTNIGRYAFKRLDYKTQFKVKTEEVKNLILGSVSGIKPHQITVDKNL